MSNPTVLRVGSELTLDLNNRKARRSSRTAKVSPTQTRLLDLMKRHPRRVFTRRELGHKLGIAPSGVNLHVFKLRLALGEDVIRTLKGRGYQLGITGTDRARPEPISEIGKLELHGGLARQVWFADRGPVDLEEVEYRLLDCLIRHAGGTATHRALIRAGRFQSSDGYYRRAMSTLMRKLRGLVGADVITNVRRVGYQLEAEVVEVDRVEVA